jgi:FHA domain-containing protein/type VI secretion system protein
MQLTNPVLSLRVAKFNDEPVAEPITIEFGPEGGTIGRATDCTLVLPDQQRAISRVHARVEFRAGEYLLCDLGSNPSVLNQRALGGTREARLADGDRVLIGAYLLEVSLAERDGRDGRTQGLASARDPLASAGVLGGLSTGELQNDPFGAGALDPLGQPGFGAQGRISTRPGFTGSESDHVSPELQAFSMPVAAPPQQASLAGASTPKAAGIPADYDPLADALAQWESSTTMGRVSAGLAPQPALPDPLPHAAPAPLPPLAPASGSTPLAGPTGLPSSLLDGPASGGGATPFDDLFGAAQPGQPAPAAAAAPNVSPAMSAAAPAFAPAPAPMNPPSPLFAPAPGPMNAPAAMHPAAAPGIVPAVSPASAEAPAFAPTAPPLSAAVPASAPAPSHAASPAFAFAPAHASPPAHAPTRPPVTTPATASDSATLASLLEGLRLDPSRTPNLAAPDLARLIGVMLREALRGAMAVLRSRSMTKREARLDTTLIVARDNNPLKFFPDVDSALAQMLTSQSAGYLPPAEALERAFIDIESHELAVIAGMRAALAHVLSRFDPAALEAQIDKPGVMDKVLSNRKAKLWDRFVEMQAGIAREADDDFQKLFGKAFNDAYEAQIEALAAARKSSKKDPADRP